VEFMPSTTIARIVEEGGRITRVKPTAGRWWPTPIWWRWAASRPSGQAAGAEVPVYPVKGYSLTVPIVNEALAPVPPAG
jgi:D-amino-acid dehydrogenase